MKPCSLLVPLLALAILLAAPPHANAVQGVAPRQAVEAVAGYWYTQDKDGIIELYACGDEVCGRFHWLRQESPQQVPRDTRNPDPDKKQRPLCALQFMGGFVASDSGTFEDGWIYSPRHGAVFSARMALVDADTLDLHGYLLTPLLGESQVWHRAAAAPSCLAAPEATNRAAP